MIPKSSCTRKPTSPRRGPVKPSCECVRWASTTSTWTTGPAPPAFRSPSRTSSGGNSRARSLPGGKAGPLKEGDRVWVTCRVPCGTCEFCLSGRDNLCVREGYFGLDLPGGYAEYVKVPIANLNPLPSHVSFEDAAASQIAFGTAWHVLINRRTAGRPERPDRRRPPASGAPRSRWRDWRGTVFATASSDRKLERAKALGARPGRLQQAISRAGHRAHGGRRVDVMMQHVGGQVFPEPPVPEADRRDRDGRRPRRRGLSLDVIRSSRASSDGRIEERSVTELSTSCAGRPGELKRSSTGPPVAAAEAHHVVESREIFGKILLLLNDARLAPGP